MKITKTPHLSRLLLLLFVTQTHLAFAAGPIREPWVASRIQGSPGPPKPYVAEPVFEDLTINEGLEMVALDGRLFVMERRGKIWSFVEHATDPKAELFVDLKARNPQTTSAYGLAFHPDWRTNRQVFLTYTIGNNLENGTLLSRFRFTTSAGEAPRIEPDSEEVIFRWRSGGHNGANLQFGPDGMLYVSTGDASPPNPPDGFHTGQDNSDILSCVLRIDVNHQDEALKYRVPSDNPFVGRTGVRPEIWAFGFRNPWKMSFDSKGRLWLGDVGWELWEMIHRVEKGGNYGWSATEAVNPIKPDSASPLAPISPPVTAHSHTEAASITGGFEYRGTRLPKLRGAYIYGDYETGKIWTLRHDGQRVTEHIEIADTPHRISTFGVGNDGELYYIHYGNPSTLCRLTPNPRAGKNSDFPRQLSRTGLFANTRHQQPNTGVYEFAVHEPMWQDGAEATRYVALPNTNAINTDIVYHKNGSRRITTTWPENAVLAKTIRLGETPVETQVLHFNGNTWNGYSYRWNKAATDAELVGRDGDEFEVSAKNWQGGTRYRIPGRAECLRCHSMWNKFTPAFEPMQLAEFIRFPKQSPQEVATDLGLANADFFHKNDNGHLINSRGGGSLEKRARSWLHANCAHCHRRHGGGTAPLEVNYERSLSESFTLWQQPTRGEFGLTDTHLIVPGHPARSVLNYRVSAIGSSHMPPIGPREVDDHGANLLWKWIAKLPSQTPAQSIPIGILDEPWMSDTSPAMRVTHAIASGEMAETEAKTARTNGLTSQNQNVRALFERFRPPNERPVPAQLNPNRILSLRGNSDTGATLLSPTGKLAACFACHQLGEAGRDLGPELSEVATRLNREQILESLIHPSKTIAPEYRIWSVQTKEGEAQSGFIINRTDKSITLKLTTGQSTTIPVQQVQSTKPQALSLMPEGLLILLTEQETADLLAYLVALKQAGK
jgi:putative heme-binding domain-containing protein